MAERLAPIHPGEILLAEFLRQGKRLYIWHYYMAEAQFMPLKGGKFNFPYMHISSGEVVPPLKCNIVVLLLFENNQSGS